MATKVTFSKTPPTLDTTQATQIVRGSIALSGSYVTGGDALSFVGNPVQSNQRPISVRFWEEPAEGTVPTALVFSYRNVSAKPNVSNGVLQIQGAGTMSSGVPTAGDELAASTYPSILTGTVLEFEAIFPLGY